MNGSADEQHDAHVKCYRIAVAVAYGAAVAAAYDKHLAKAGSTVATAADPTVFRWGSDFAAWIGLVPRQDSTGGKQKHRGRGRRLVFPRAADALDVGSISCVALGASLSESRQKSSPGRACANDEGAARAPSPEERADSKGGEDH
jgi:hypothetical protein